MNIIAIFGPSCSGKTAIAAALGEYLNLPVRHCGDIVKDRVKQLGMASAADLPVQEHNTIDDETRNIALNSKSTYIIEGTYLEDVLAGYSGTTFIKLECDSQTRLNRMKQRDNNEITESNLHLRDSLDESIYDILFKDKSNCGGNHIVSLDTEPHSIRECALAIANIVKDSVVKK